MRVAMQIREFGAMRGDRRKDYRPKCWQFLSPAQVFSASVVSNVVGTVIVGAATVAGIHLVRRAKKNAMEESNKITVKVVRAKEKYTHKCCESLNEGVFQTVLLWKAVVDETFTKLQAPSRELFQPIRKIITEGIIEDDTGSSPGSKLEAVAAIQNLVQTGSNLVDLGVQCPAFAEFYSKFLVDQELQSAANRFSVATKTAALETSKTITCDKRVERFAAAVFGALVSVQSLNVAHMTRKHTQAVMTFGKELVGLYQLLTNPAEKSFFIRLKYAALKLQWCMQGSWRAAAQLAKSATKKAVSTVKKAVRTVKKCATGTLKRFRRNKKTELEQANILSKSKKFEQAKHVQQDQSAATGKITHPNKETTEAQRIKELFERAKKLQQKGMAATRRAMVETVNLGTQLQKWLSFDFILSGMNNDTKSFLSTVKKLRSRIYYSRIRAIFASVRNLTRRLFNRPQSTSSSLKKTQLARLLKNVNEVLSSVRWLTVAFEVIDSELSTLRAPEPEPPTHADVAISSPGTAGGSSVVPVPCVS